MRPGLVLFLLVSSFRGFAQTAAPDVETRLQKKIDVLQKQIDELKSGKALEQQKLQYEIKKLDQDTSWESRILGFLQPIGTILASIVVGFLGYWANQRLAALQAKKAEDDRVIALSTHWWDVYQSLGSQQAAVRAGAIVQLGERLKAGIDQNTIARVLITASKHEKDPDLHKLIGDTFAGLYRKPAPFSGKSPLAQFDFQGARLTNTWWARIDARGVDLYAATLTRASLREAHFEKATLKNARLDRTTLADAHFDGANLDGADLEEARAERACFKDATLRGAIFDRANLTGAIFDGADLAHARFDQAICKGVDFSKAKDLTGVDLTKIVL